MNKSNSAFLKSALYAGVAGAVVALSLYWLSSWFFEAKTQQTLIKSTELGGKALGGELVFPVGAEVPGVSFKEMSTKAVYDLNKDENPIKIINFWASWCEPCVEEFSSFARLIRELNGEASFVGINEDQSVADAKDFLKAFSTDFKGLEAVYFGYDEGKQWSKQYGILALPETFLVDRDGKLIRRISGFEKWDAPAAVVYFKALIEKSKESGK